MKFQYIFLAVFGIVGVAAIICFATCPVPEGKDKSGLASNGGAVVIWGTFPYNTGFSKMVDQFNIKYQKNFQVNYQFHDPKTFDTEIIEALASGRGPDVLLLPDDLVLRHTNKIEIVPYASFPQSTYVNMFAQAAEIYMRSSGSVALPFAIDPMVMYWNRDLFNNASITEPPKVWDDFLAITPKLTKRDQRTNGITQSAVAFGEYGNVDHAKDVLAMLMLQVGNPIVALSNDKPSASLGKFENNQMVSDQSVVNALRFYMDFSDPRKPIYSWNRSKSSALDEFINGDLAVYFDHASAYGKIAEKNPHLNFAVAPVPLPYTAKVEITLAKMYGLSVLKSAPNKATAFQVISRMLTDIEPPRDFAAAFDLPPVTRSALSQKPTEATMSVFYDAAIRSRTWLDPKPEDSDKMFMETVDAVSSGRLNAASAIAAMQAKLNSLLAPYKE
jgi:ABC-type glycerol-3-phosphate transport system substrate-binding protein